MKTYLIVDGYNIINSWNKLNVLVEENLEEAREKLITIMESFGGFKGYNVIIVFDAYMQENPKESKEEYEHVKVIYTQKNQTADAYIEKKVTEIPEVYNTIVATSDFTVQRMIIAHNAQRISARELEKEVDFVNNILLKRHKKQFNMENNYVSKTLSDDVLNKLEEWRKNGIDEH